MRRLYLGTSGWSYPSGFGKWQGVFYPSRWHGDELRFYAERFPTVEVNTSFYRLPTQEIVQSWLERTPNDFLFTVKLYRKFTHPEFYQREEQASPAITLNDICSVRGSLDILASGGKLGALLVQYPEFFHKKPETLSALVRTLDIFRDYPLAVELRHASWNDCESQDVLAHFSAARVHVDEPFYSNISEQPHQQAPLEYWRFHGRNAADWCRPGSGHHRYDYLYNEDELSSLAQAIAERPFSGERRFVFFNNHVNGKAIANAIALGYLMNVELPYQRFTNMAVSFPELKAITGGDGTLGL